jgi:hypothetical protein
MSKNIFTQKNVGDSVVYAAPDGSSTSATITFVRPRISVHLRLAVPDAQGSKTAVVARDNWSRLTAFPKDCKFFVLGAL